MEKKMEHDMEPGIILVLFVSYFIWGYYGTIIE